MVNSDKHDLSLSSEQIYQSVFRLAPSMIGITRFEDGVIYDANDVYCRNIGYSREEIKGRTSLSLNLWVNKDDRKKVKNLLFKDGSYKNIEILFKRKDGSVFHGLQSAELIEMNNERYIIAVTLDITKQKQVQETLRESEEKYRLLIENQTDMVVKFDTEGKLLFVSPSYCKTFDKTQDELLGKTFTPLIHEDDRDAAEKTIGKVYQPPYTGYVEERAMTKDGWRWQAWLNTAVLNEKSEVESIIATGRDINDRKQAEEALRESEEYHRGLFDNSPTALYLQDFTEVEEQVKSLTSAGITDLGSYLRANPQKAFQLSRAVVFSSVNQAAVDLYRAGSKRNLLGLLNRVLIRGDFQHFIDQVVAFTNGEDSWAGEARNYNFQKEIIDIVIKKGVINRQANGMSKVLVSISDVTDLHKAHKNKERLEAQLHQARKMESLGLLAGGVAHDLNNILSGIVTYPELLLMDLPEDSPLRRPIKTIQESGMRAVDVVADLLTIARGVATGKEVLNLNTVVTEYLGTPEHLELGKTHSFVDFKTELDPSLLNMSGSSSHIKKSLMNLVINASEAIEGSGTVTISTMNRYLDEPLKGYEDVHQGEYAVLSVSDEGSGISPEDLVRIFEPFYTKKIMGRSGTGLGLAVVWNTVQDHNGYINVNTGDKGTVFELYFPVTREEVADEKEALPLEDYLGHGEKILVVDDEERQREIAGALLTKLGYVPEAAESGEEAIEYVKEHPVDLIVLDMVMPKGINGRETYEAIIKIRPGQKAIIASGYAKTREVDIARELGAGKYIKKPYTLEKMGIAVKEELEK